MVISLGAFPNTQYASYPTPISKEHNRILMSKQSPFYHFDTLVGDGMTSGNLSGNSNSSY